MYVYIYVYIYFWMHVEFLYLSIHLCSHPSTHEKGGCRPIHKKEPDLVFISGKEIALAKKSVFGGTLGLKESCVHFLDFLGHTCHKFLVLCCVCLYV